MSVASGQQHKVGATVRPWQSVMLCYHGPCFTDPAFSLPANLFVDTSECQGWCDCSILPHKGRGAGSTPLVGLGIDRLQGWHRQQREAATPAFTPEEANFLRTSLAA